MYNFLLKIVPFSTESMSLFYLCVVSIINCTITRSLGHSTLAVKFPFKFLGIHVLG